MREMLFVDKPPVGIESVGGCPELGTLPDKWLGYAFHWKDGYSPQPVFIGQASVAFGDLEDGDASGSSIEVYLFGYRLELSEAGCDDPRMQDGFFVEYIVLEKEARVVRHRLNQTGSAAYSSTDENDDDVSACDFDWKNAPRLDKRPKWKPSEAYWPTCDGKPMTFVTQWILPDNDVTRRHLTFDEYNYLFVARSGNGLVFKVTTQETDLQTAEEHYREEEKRFKAD